jgi:ubiquinone/menaquinone biosynthesis C-methylase UbiE
MNDLDQVRMKIAEVEAALLADAPQLPQLLQQIDRVLKAQGDIVTQLSDPEIQTLVKGLKTWQKQAIVPAKVASKSKSKIADSVAFDFSGLEDL